MAHDLEQLKQDHPDVAKLFADDWLQYRKSEILPELTREAQSTCDRINRIYFEDTAEAERLFRELVPEAGEGVDFRPPIRLDYGLGLKIGDRTFINMDLLIVGGTSLAVYPAASLVHYVRPGVPIYLVDPGAPDVRTIRNPLTHLRERAAVGMPELAERLRRESQPE